MVKISMISKSLKLAWPMNTPSDEIFSSGAPALRNCDIAKILKHFDNESAKAQIALNSRLPQNYKNNHDIFIAYSDQIGKLYSDSHLLAPSYTTEIYCQETFDLYMRNIKAEPILSMLGLNAVHAVVNDDKMMKIHTHNLVYNNYYTFNDKNKDFFPISTLPGARKFIAPITHISPLNKQRIFLKLLDHAVTQRDAWGYKLIGNPNTTSEMLLKQAKYFDGFITYVAQNWLNFSAQQSAYIKNILLDTQSDQRLTLQQVNAHHKIWVEIESTPRYQPPIRR